MTNLSIIACEGEKECKSCEISFPITEFRLYGPGKKYRYPNCRRCSQIISARNKYHKREIERSLTKVENLTNESWRPVKDYYGLYEVSNLGRVKRLNCIVSHKSKGRLSTKERLLKQSLSQYRYRKVSLSKDDVTLVVNVHLLVWDAWGDKDRDGYKLVVDHIDNNKENNSIYNLQCITTRLNSSKDRKNKHSIFTGVSKAGHGKWISTISIEGKNKKLGVFDSEDEANRAYQDALKKIMEAA